ncbi:MAG: GNAT family N-acetyltransferase [Gammaproteobacteria bacterium]|nr:GNAT family N-acetyltransferase [Gammaproteobacteria bacterium]
MPERVTHSTSISPAITAVTAADFGTVAALAETIWRSHYPAMISMAQIDFMLARRYTPERLSRYLDAADCWLELLTVDGIPVGYCSYALTDARQDMKLQELYLLPDYRGLGLGSFMLRHVEAQARRRSCTALMLTVNKDNADAFAVYRHAGFNVREEAVFDIGNGFVMDDYVMVKSW